MRRSAKYLCNFIAIHVRHSDINEGNIGQFGRRNFNAEASVGRSQHSMALRGQHHRHDGARIIFIFYQKNAKRCDRCFLAWFWLLAGWLLTFWYANDESAPFTSSLAVRRYVSIVQYYKLAHQRQANPQAALWTVERPLALYENIEHAGQQFGRYADSRVIDRKHDLVIACLQFDIDLSAIRRVLERIIQKIGDNLLHACCIGIDEGGIDIHPQRMVARAPGHGQRFDAAMDDFCQIHRAFGKRYLA